MLVTDFLTRNARFFGAYEALVVPDGRVSTWLELEQRTESLASGLSTILAPGERLAMHAGNCAEYVDFFFGCAKSGVVGAATNIRHSEDELVEYLKKVEPSALLVHADLAERGEHLASKLECVQHVIGFGGDHGFDRDLEDLISTAPVRPRPKLHPDDPYQMCPTSGTTGSTKSVVMSHRNATTAMLAYLAEYDAREGDTWLQMNPLYLNAGGPAHLTHVLWKGGRTIVVPGGFEPRRFLEAVDRFKVTHTSLVPTMVRMMLDLGPQVISRYDVTSLRSVVLGGAPVTAPFLEEAEAVFGRVFNSTYGMTETYSTGLILRTEAVVDESGAVRPDRLATAGRPHLHLDARVVAEDGSDVPADGETVGEIWLQGDSITSGYFRDPDATRDSRSADGAWFKTGDLATKDSEGYVKIVDRLKDVIISGGLNVTSGEIEGVLSTHPEVLEVSVIGVPHPTWGEAVHAVIVRRTKGMQDELTRDELTEQLAAIARERLGGYKRPKSYSYVVALPRNSTGKVLKRELRRTLAGQGGVQAE
ncbi:long-chain fatty acid--CoA ligase [Nocardioides endophyticus]|uniref:Long-chain fatty acid--CoA ligase n=1 Tax=Nocardioides endophyticus TaxID=1353775 RepID=A0ABP8YF04_9ACTN